MPVHDNAALTADTVLLASAGGTDHVLLVRRGGEPFAGRWAFPGGFVEPDEILEDGARRELEEETGLHLDVPLAQLGAYGAPGRDPRGRVVSVAWWARLTTVDAAAALPAVSGGDDAADAHWVPVAQVLADDALAFDHAGILRDALAADAALHPAAGIAVRFDLPDADALAVFDAQVAELLPGIRAEEPGTLTYAVHEVADAPLARLFFETYTATGHADHEARPQTARFLERIGELVDGVRVEHLVQRDAVRR
ncbi:NUDIX domain-containing protein [Amnibacterium endophyticum]|uniref:NUDIX domain-containing protein n=1 Tax=Amnibacterium endophyticum TaxID=2109337 RepID=A0ABW4LGY3_9MICO